MTGHLRIKSPKTQLGVLLLVYFVPQLILASLSQIILGGKIDLTAPENIATMKWVQAASSLIFFFLPALLYAWFSFRGRYFYFLGFRAAEKSSMYVLFVWARSTSLFPCRPQ